MESDETRIKRMESELRLLAEFIQGITPDKNTQTEAEVQAVEDEVEAPVNRYLPYRATV